MQTKGLVRNTVQYLKSVLLNPLFWGGLGLFLILGVAGLLTLDNVIMPSYTRQGGAISVPDVTSLSYERARITLEAQGLKVERVVHRFNPNVERDVVVDQNPPASASVKPGRHIYVSVNSGTVPVVTVPRVEGLALREAKNRMINAGLRVVSERPDPIPSPYENTVTGQSPGAGSSVERGSGVTLWYSTGLGSDYVEIPDVVGMTASDARAVLLELKLRSVAVDAATGSDIVTRQSRSAGTRVREGFEIRLFVAGTDETEIEG